MTIRHMPIRWLSAFLVVIGFTAVTGRVVAHDRPAGPLHKSRSCVVARNGIAATSQPLATDAAIRILQAGGNAVDAAIAANAVLGLVEPMSCGIGGDLFAIVWDAKSKKLYGLNASGRAPGAATIDFYHSKGFTEIPGSGPLSWSVPGCVDGWDQLRTRFGSKSWEEVLAPAVAYAEEGFPVSELIAAAWNGAATRLAKVRSSAACYLPNGRAPKFAEVFRNHALARSYRTIAGEGRDGFYKGSLAEAIVAYSKSVGGLFERKDLEDHTSTWVEPVTTNYRGYDIWELPPNGQGIAVLQILNLLEPYDLKAMGPQSAEALHLMIEAKKLAYEDRAKFYADPEFAKVPVAELISKPYAQRRGKLIDPARSNARPTHGDPKPADTIYMTVADKAGNAVSLIQSNFNSFGSSHVAGELGFVLQNRGSSFALDPLHANRLEPHKRPFHTIIPGFVTKDGKAWLSFGLMGGDMQAQGHAQVLVNIIDFGMDVQAACDAPRFYHSGSSRPTGAVAKDGGSVALESEIGPEVRKALEAKGHRIVNERESYGAYQAIRIDADNGVLIGGSESRHDGQAIGY
jgi:gamma-glutamyltranspeptidase / glutathione hydrolase